MYLYTYIVFSAISPAESCSAEQRRILELRNFNCARSRSFFLFIAGSRGEVAVPVQPYKLSCESMGAARETRCEAIKFIRELSLHLCGTMGYLQLADAIV